MQNEVHVDTHWRAPAVGDLKINVDASIYDGSSKFSVGMILRDHTGSFCRARNLCREGLITVFEAETWGVLEAIKWALQLGISKVQIESDSLITVQAIKTGARNYLEVGVMLHEARELLSARPDISVSFVKKQANTIAHLLARVPCQANSFNEFFLLHI